MFKPNLDRRAVVLFMLLATILVVAILASVILTLMLSQFRLTHHQVSRAQAYYAALAGVNYAIEKLRLGNDAAWPRPGVGVSYTHLICRSACTPPDINDLELPVSIQQVAITVKDPNLCLNSPAGINACISATAIYTYTP